MKIETTSAQRWRKTGPYSIRLQRGPCAAVDGRSAEGRFIRALEAELLELCSDPITVAERLLVDQAIRLKLQLDSLDEKFMAAMAGDGQWTDHDRRCHHAVNNAYRLVLRELRVAPAPYYRNGRRRHADPQAEIARLVSESRARKAAQHHGAK